MKTQRILALTLAAATATSMFASFSASATDADFGIYTEKFNPSNITADTTGKDISGAVLNTELDKVWTGTVQDAIDEGKTISDLYFLSNYKQVGATSYSDLAAAIEAVQDEKKYDLSSGGIEAAAAAGDEIAKAAVKAINGYFTTESTSDVDIYDSISPVEETGYAPGTRATEIDSFDKYRTELKDTVWTYYDMADLKGYAVYTTTSVDKPLSLENAFSSIAGTKDQIGENTAYLQYLNDEYERFFGEDGLLSATTTIEEVYDELLAKAEALNEEDYKPSEWIDVQSNIQKAQAKAEEGKYKDAIDFLNAALKVKGIAPKADELGTALEGLFKDGGVYRTELNKARSDVSADKNLLGGYIDWSSYAVGTQLKLGEYTGTQGVHTYEKGDYKESEWVDFAGSNYTVSNDADKFVVGAYRKAMYTYAAATKSSTKSFVSQAAVDEALAELDEAIMAMDPTFSSSDWATVKLQEALDAAEAVVETDYRTSSKYYKDFVKAKEYVEKLLNADNVKNETADKASDDLVDAIKKLDNCKLLVPTSTKNDLKATIKEAKELLEDKTGKSAKQIIALQDAIKVAEDEDNELDLISEYEAAQKALDAAIVGYKQVQGWYQDGGKWYFGKDDAKATGWLQDNGKWYFLNADGSMVANNWVKSDAGYWYWMEGSGAMATSKWIYTGNKWYYMNANGIMATGWNKIDGSWYYLQPSNGAMVSNGWYWIGGKCYYFYGSGKMAANTTIGGYKVDASGAWVK